MKPPPTLRAMLIAVLARPEWDNNVARLAEAMEMTPAALGRVRNGHYPLSAGKCLKLAEVAGLPPGDVLTAAGKIEVHQAIERLYGAQPDVTPKQREHLEQWAKLPPDVRDLLGKLMDVAATHGKAKKK